MNPLALLSAVNLKTIGIALMVGFASGSFTAGLLMARYKDAVWSASASEQKSETANQLKVATQHARVLETTLVGVTSLVGVNHEERQSQLDRLTDDNRRLLAEHNGLQDPGRRAGRSGALSNNSAATAIPVDPTTDSRLSTELTEFLFSETRRADKAAEWARTCDEWRQAVIAKLSFF